jgi:hypothetical protein
MVTGHVPGDPERGIECALLPGDRVVNTRLGEHGAVINSGVFVMVLADDGCRVAWPHGEVVWEEGTTIARENRP